MTKSAKHKRERKADFVKAKLKLGKGKQLAANATNTAFASKTIALPNQVLGERKENARDDEPRSKRGQTLPEILVQCRHYSASVKRDALKELSNLLQAHPQLAISQHMSSLLATLAHLLSDITPAVRTSTIELFRLIMATAGASSDPGPSSASRAGGAIQALGGSVVLFALSALSELDEGVRLDALEFFSLVLDETPSWVVSSAVEQARLTDALLGVLKLRTGAAAQDGTYTSTSNDVSPSMRRGVLKTLTGLLSAAAAAAGVNEEDDNTYMRSAFTDERSMEAFLGSQSRRQTRKAPRVPLANGACTCRPLPTYDIALAPLTALVIPPGALLPSYASAADSTAEGEQDLLQILYPVLMAAFLDAAPSAFGIESNDDQRESVRVVLELAEVLLARAEGQEGAEAEAKEKQRLKLVKGFLKHVGAYFPFGARSAAPSQAEEKETREMNLVFCSIGAGVFFSPGKALEKGLAGLGVAVRAWILALLSPAAEDDDALKAVPLGPEAYEDLEQTFWGLLSAKDGAADVWDVLLGHFARAKAAQKVKKAAGDFVMRVVLAQTAPGYRGPRLLDGRARERTQQWITQDLAKWIWELGTRDLDATETVFEFWADCLRAVVPPAPLSSVHPSRRFSSNGSTLNASHRDALLSTEARKTLAGRMMPFWRVVVVPGTAKEKAVFGPFSDFKGEDGNRLKEKATDLAVQLVRELGDQAATLQRAVNAVMGRAPAGPDSFRSRWTLIAEDAEMVL